MSGGGGMCPTDPAHGRLVHRPAATREQEWAGDSYVCPEPGCYAGMLVMSGALRAELRAQTNASRGWTS